MRLAKPSLPAAIAGSARTNSTHRISSGLIAAYVRMAQPYPLAALSVLALGAATALPKQGIAADSNRVTRVTLEASATGGSEIAIDGSAAFTPEIYSTTTPLATVITISGKWNAGPTKAITVSRGGVASFSAGPLAEDPNGRVRIVAHTGKAMPFQTKSSADKKHWTIELEAPTPIPQPTPPSAMRGTPFAKPTATPLVVATSQAAAAHHAAITAPPAATPSHPIIVTPLMAATHHSAVMASLAATGSVSERLDKYVTLDFIDASVSDVVKSIALQSGINIVMATDSKDKSSAGSAAITVSLKRVTVRDALDMVARLSGYRYIVVGSTFVVGSGAGIAAFSRDASIGSVSTRAIPFTFSDSAKLLESVQAAFPNVNVSLVIVGSDAAKSDSGSGGSSGETPSLPNGQTPDNAMNPGKTGGPATTDAGAGVPAKTHEVALSVSPKGGVLNVVGSTDETEAVSQFVTNTEMALLESGKKDAEARAEKDAQAIAKHADEETQRTLALSQKYASYVTETYKIHYGAPKDLVNLLRQLVPTVSILYGPVQGFTTGASGSSTTFGSNITNSNPAADAAAGAAGGGLSAAGAGAGSTGSSPSSSTGGSIGSNSHAGIPSTLLLNGTPTDVAQAQKLLAQIDVSVPQLHFEARVVDLENADTQALGMRYDFSQSVYVGETQTGKDGVLNSGGAAGTVAVNTASGLARNLNFGSIYRTPYAIGLTLDALANNNHTRTLANPNLSALDGEPATAFIGDQIKFVTSITQGTNGPNITTDTATVGITLKVTGKSSPDGSITLYIHPEVSNVSSYLTLTNGISLPQIATRYVDTTIRVKDGETIAIGGLIQEQDVRNLQKVPILGDLPILGKLFTSSNTQKNRSNVVVFITSHVLKD